MTLRVKIISYLLIFFVWLVTGLVVLEIGFRCFNYCVYKFNPLIRKLEGKPTWFFSGVEVEKDDIEESVQMVSPLIWNVNRAKFFLQLDDYDKRLFAECFGIKVFFRYCSEKKFRNPYQEELYFQPEILLSQLRYESVDEEEGVKACYIPEYQLEDKLVSDFFIMQTPIGDVIWYKEGKNHQEDYKSPWEIPYFEYKKNFRIPGYEFRTNNVGFRDSDVVLPKPSGVFRIVAVGGSTTEEGPTVDETYPNFLEALLNKELGNTCKIEVINAGIPGITLNKIWIRLPDFLLLQPDLVIISEGVNDITHILIPHWLGNLKFVKRLLSKSDLILSLFPLFFLPSEEVIENDMVNMSFAYINKIVNYLHKHRVSLLLTDMHSPNYEKMNFEEKVYFQYITKTWWGGRLVDYRLYVNILKIFNENLRNYAEKNDVPLVSISDVFSKESPSVFNDICHMKLVGIKLKAEAIGNFIREKNLIDCNK